MADVDQRLFSPISTDIVDEIVRPDGPFLMAMGVVYGQFDSKDVADITMKIPAREVIARFADVGKETPKREMERICLECFYSNFPDIKKWLPPDIPESPPSWLTYSHPRTVRSNEIADALHARDTFSGERVLENSPGHATRSFPDLNERRRDDKALYSEPRMPQVPGSDSTAERVADAENEFALNLISKWADLGRKTNCGSIPSSRFFEGACSRDIVSSLLAVPHGFIVPGGRFREMYYWDAYWIIRGLLYSGMVSTARGMILNFSYLVRRFGFIPNGTRSYYLDRSQPPVFSMMLSAYFTFTEDLELIRETYLDVEREYLYWLEDTARQVCVPIGAKNYYLSRYVGHRSTPRPESCKQDLLVASCVAERAQRGNAVDPEGARANILRNIRAAAESGWDFSSRWVPDDVDVTVDGVMPNLETESLLPVDLNSFLYHAELYLLHFGRLLQMSGADTLLSKKPRAPAFFQQRAGERRKAMLKLLWNDEVKWWFDFDITKGRQSARVTAAGVAALLMQLHSSVHTQTSRLFGDPGPPSASCTGAEEVAMEDGLEIAAHERQLQAVRFLVEESGLWNTWGLSATQLETGQQWDGSNSWPPLLQMALEAMINLENRTALEAAKRMVDSHIFSCMHAYKRLGALPEKSSSLSPGSCGSGGEYACQTGFGWSIGVALELLFFKRADFRPREIKRLRREFGSVALCPSVKSS